MYYDNDLIIGRVPKKIKERTKENMEVYNMGLYDSFKLQKLFSGPIKSNSIIFVV